MPSDPKITPKAVKAPQGARVMEVTWADGHRSILPHETLRGYCPCAHCQGHQGTIKRVEIVGELALELRDIERVGNYALSFTWGDAHSSGIYSYKYLRALCQCETCKPSFEEQAKREESHDGP